MIWVLKNAANLHHSLFLAPQPAGNDKDYDDSGVGDSEEKISFVYKSKRPYNWA